MTPHFAPFGRKLGDAVKRLDLDPTKYRTVFIRDFDRTRGYGASFR